MASKQAKVRCPHCSVEFGFALPQKYVERPNKNLKFICEYCTERFSVQVSELFSEDGTELASLKIRHQSVSGLLLYSSWEEVIQSHFGEAIEESDPISAFGKEWKPASMFEELSTIFPNADRFDSVDDIVEDEDQEFIVEVEEEPSYENDLFMDKPLEQSSWNDELEDPFDIPISNMSDTIEDEEDVIENQEDIIKDEEDDFVDLIADGAMDIFLEESEEVPPVMVEEDSEDPFLAISDEIEIQQDHSIDALISTLDSEIEEKKLPGTNTLDLLQSEEDMESEPFQEPWHSEVEHDEIEESVEEVVSEAESQNENFETMNTVIDSSPFKSLGLDSEETIQSAGLVEENEFLLATATVVEEDSNESPAEQTQTIISTSSSWIEEDHEVPVDEDIDERTDDISFFSPDSWEEEIEESNNGSESIDYDQTEEEDESQSALNPAFQISTKKVVRKQYWAVVSVVALSLIAAVLVVRYSSLSDVSSFFIPIDDSEVQKVQPNQKTAKEQKIDSKEVKTQTKAKTETVVQKDNGTSDKPKTQEPPKADVSKSDPPKKEPAKDVNKEQKSMLVVAPKKEAFLDEKPLSKQKNNQVKKNRNLPKLPPMDPKRATREGWIKLEDKSYESAKAIFEDVIKSEPTPEAFFGLGFAEERMAERYKDRKDFIRVEAHYDQAHKYYCEAMEYYSREDIVKDELRFDIRYLQARLKVISRACI